jgi:hypothetical protein
MDNIFPGRMIFSAILQSDSDEDAMQVEDEKLLFIKFVQQYSEKAHDYCASQGCSPRLLGYETLAGGWIMVVMEAVDVSVYLPFVKSGLLSPTFPADRELRPAVARLVEGLHNEGYVHGDLRDANLLVSTDGRQESMFMLVDFDWAGMAGVVKYPANVSRIGIRRPEGAVDGQLIEKAHDLEMLSYFLPESEY